MRLGHFFSFLIIAFSSGVHGEYPECIAPPISDDPEINEAIRTNCENHLKQQRLITQQKTQMNEVSTKACSPDCPSDKKKILSDNYEIFCASYCQAIVPNALASQISCTSKRMCTWLDKTQTQRWQELAKACLEGTPEGGKGFLTQTAQASETLLNAPRRLMESTWTLSKNVWNHGFHDAINMELVSAEKQVKSKIRSIKKFPDYLSNQYEIMKCLEPEVAARLACKLGTVVLLDAAAGGAFFKLTTVAAQATLTKRAYELTSKTLSAEDPDQSVSSAIPDDSVQIHPETGLPVFPDELIKKDNNVTRERSSDGPNAVSSSKVQNLESMKLREAQGIYAKAKANGDSHLQFLERAGYDLTTHPPRSASLNEIGDLYHTEVLKAAHAKGISRGDILEAATPYRLSDGSTRLIKVGDPIPEGAVRQSVDYSDKEFMEVLAQGKFPLSEGEAYSNLPMTIKEHDSAHLSSFVEYPEAMAELSKQARELKATGKLEKHYQKSDDENYDPLRLRVFSALETSSFYEPHTRTRLQGIPGLKDGQVSKPQQLTSYFKRINSAELNAWLNQVDTIQRTQTRHFGGATRDLIHREFNHPAMDLNQVHQAELEIHRLKELKQAHPDQFEREARKVLPQLISTQWNFSQVTPLTFVRGAFKPDSPEGKKMREVQCSSRGLSATSSQKISKVYGC